MVRYEYICECGCTCVYVDRSSYNNMVSEDIKRQVLFHYRVVVGVKLIKIETWKICLKN